MSYTKDTHINLQLFNYVVHSCKVFQLCAGFNNVLRCQLLRPIMLNSCIDRQSTVNLSAYSRAQTSGNTSVLKQLLLNLRAKILSALHTQKQLNLRAKILSALHTQKQLNMIFSYNGVSCNSWVW